ncbi:Uncharacterised protein [Vibrio cholerae]|nr:Uncharacterised protein [Vibrio cholerae]CSC66174.1 Uncharacterised protein [Vibrio cholerae]CSC97447.1 Uncharacterised protein [Vibrio cholerae]CSD21271.1 Uncharacterised protein [Vibrio cholerae]CSI56559.1 Uncharacterised protein [Vibrio cholerae]
MGIDAKQKLGSDIGQLITRFTIEIQLSNQVL